MGVGVTNFGLRNINSGQCRLRFHGGRIGSLAAPRLGGGRYTTPMSHTINRQLRTVDVFTAIPFKGNPVAVVFEADDLDDATLQSIARWTNLSETTFVCKPSSPAADYRLRIFTPAQELPFAGHPTVGTARALLDSGMRPKTPGELIQECGRGHVRIRIDGDRLYFALPTPRFADPSDSMREALIRSLGIEANEVAAMSVIDVGPVWATVAVRDGSRVLAMRPQFDALAVLSKQGIVGVNVFASTAADAPYDIEVRSFVPGDGIPEDPVCGSGNGCVAALIRRDRLLNKQRYVAGQGQCVGRDGRVFVELGDETIWVGGHAITVVTAEICF
jgi:PhzF family phenazine biosynthesis protein